MDEKVVKLGEELPIDADMIMEMRAELKGLRSRVLSMEERHVCVNRSEDAFNVIRYCIEYLSRVASRPDFPEERKKPIKHCFNLMLKWLDTADRQFVRIDG